MTDWQTPIMVLFTQAEGMSVLHETVYEDRFVYVPALQAMGGEIELFSTCLGGPPVGSTTPATCTPRWCGAYPSCTAPKLRSLTCEPASRASSRRPPAEGTSLLRGVHHLERGYHRPAEQLQALGLSLRKL